MSQTIPNNEDAKKLNEFARKISIERRNLLSIVWEEKEIKNVAAVAPAVGDVQIEHFKNYSTDPATNYKNYFKKYQDIRDSATELINEFFRASKGGFDPWTVRELEKIRHDVDCMNEKLALLRMGIKWPEQ
jgi:hypothetical protein